MKNYASVLICGSGCTLNLEQEHGNVIISRVLCFNHSFYHGEGRHNHQSYLCIEKLRYIYSVIEHILSLKTASLSIRYVKSESPFFTEEHFLAIE